MIGGKHTSKRVSSRESSVRSKKRTPRETKMREKSKDSVETLQKSAKGPLKRAVATKTSTLVPKYPKELIPPREPSDRSYHNHTGLHLPLSKLQCPIALHPWSLSSTGDCPDDPRTKYPSTGRAPCVTSARVCQNADLSSGYRLCAGDEHPMSPTDATCYKPASRCTGGKNGALLGGKQRKSPREMICCDPIEPSSKPNYAINLEGPTFAEMYHEQERLTPTEELPDYRVPVPENSFQVAFVECLQKTLSQGLTPQAEHLTQKLLESVRSGEISFFKSTLCDYIDYLRKRDLSQIDSSFREDSLTSQISQLRAHNKRLHQHFVGLVELNKVIASPVCDKPVAMYMKRLELGKRLQEIERLDLSQTKTSGFVAVPSMPSCFEQQNSLRPGALGVTHVKMPRRSSLGTQMMPHSAKYYGYNEPPLFCG